jgi:hypothetical protein
MVYHKKKEERGKGRKNERRKVRMRDGRKEGEGGRVRE